MARTQRPLLAQAADRLDQVSGLLDRVDRAARSGRAQREPRVPGAPVHRYPGQQRAAARDPHGEGAGLGDDGGVRSQRAGGRQPARARRLLVRDRVDHQVARQPHAEPGQHLGGEHHARDAALHVARPPAPDGAVADDRVERVARPRRARLDVDHVHVPVEQQRASRPGSRKARHQLRAPGEGEPLGDGGMSRHQRRLRLGHANLRAARGQPLGQEALQRGLVARRRPVGVRHGVEADQCPHEVDELALPPVHVLAHAPLKCVESRHCMRALGHSADCITRGEAHATRVANPATSTVH